MLAAKADPYGYKRFNARIDPPILPLTASQIIPVRPLSQPPPPPVDALGAKPPPPPFIDPEPSMRRAPTLRDLLAFRPAWCTQLGRWVQAAHPALRRAAERVGPIKDRICARAKRGFDAARPALHRVYLRCLLGWLVASGWVVNQCARLPSIRLERPAGSRALQSRLPMLGSAPITTRAAARRDLERLREFERELHALIDCLEAGSHPEGCSRPGSEGTTRVPNLAEVQGRVVGVFHGDAC